MDLHTNWAEMASQERLIASTVPLSIVSLGTQHQDSMSKYDDFEIELIDLQIYIWITELSYMKKAIASKSIASEAVLLPIFFYHHHHLSSLQSIAWNDQITPWIIICQCEALLDWHWLCSVFNLTTDDTLEFFRWSHLLFVCQSADLHLPALTFPS